MNTVLVQEDDPRGFSFVNCRRNKMLIDSGFVPSKATSTGTTIAGICFRDGIILGADSRITNGTTISNQVEEKIHYIADNMYCCGAGVAADSNNLLEWCRCTMEMLRLNTQRKRIPVVAAATYIKRILYQNQGTLRVQLILGGYDHEGPHLYGFHRDGTTDRVSYATLGSGNLSAMSVIETRWRPEITENEGKQLVLDAIAAGICNDLGSGAKASLCILRNGSTEYLPLCHTVVEKIERKLDYTLKRSTTGVLSVKKINIEIVQEEQKKFNDEEMETD